MTSNTLNHYENLRTVGDLKRRLKDAKKVYVWVNWQGEDGDYIEVTKPKLLVGLGIDTPNDGAHGGKPDATAIRGSFNSTDSCIYIG